MKFCDKLKKLRIDSKYSQAELANLLGISLRTLTNYEKGCTFPKREDIYENLSQIFNVDIRYLKDDTLDVASEIYTKDDINPVLTKVVALFSGGKISEKDKDALMRAIQDAYWDTKR